MAAPEIVSGVSGESEEKLRELFSHAVVSQQGLVYVVWYESLLQVPPQSLTTLHRHGNWLPMRPKNVGRFNDTDRLDQSSRSSEVKHDGKFWIVSSRT